MIAKIPEKRTDGQSSFQDLVEYMTNRDDDQDELTDELDTSDRRRNLDVLAAVGVNLRRAAEHLRAVGRTDAPDADAIRVNLGRARRAAGTDAVTHARPDRVSDIEDGGQIDADQHQRSLARIKHNLRAAASYLRQAPEAHRDFQERARARRANLADNARAAERGNGRNRSGTAGQLDELTLLSDGPKTLITDSGIICQHNCMSLVTASAEMQSVAAQNARVKDPVYHVVISWAPGENPTDDQAFESARYALKAVGMADHQYVFAIHRDTDNVHVHIAVNRVNPDTFRAVYPERDYYKLDYAMRELELSNNWQRVAGVYSILERNGKTVIDWTSADPDSKGKRPTKAADMERYDGVESLFTFVRGEPRRAISALLKREDLSWQSIHWQLAEFGLEVRPKGQGLAVYSANNADVTPVKASDLHENLSLTRLEKRIGKYSEPRPLDAAPTKDVYDKHRPLKRDAGQRELQRQKRADDRRNLRSRYVEYKKSFVSPKVDIRAELAALAAAARDKRAQIKASGASPAAKRALYSIVSFETLREREQLKAGAAERRLKLREDKASKAMTFREWVEEKAAAGDSAAISQMRGWAYADKRKAKDAEAVTNDVRVDGLQAPTDFDPLVVHGLAAATKFRVRRDGSVHYQDQGGQDLFIDRGRAIHMAPGSPLDEQRIADALRLATEKFGGSFRLTGSDDFKQRAVEVMIQYKIEVVLNDPAQEQMKKDAARAKASMAGRPGSPDRKK